MSDTVENLDTRDLGFSDAEDEPEEVDSEFNPSGKWLLIIPDANHPFVLVVFSIIDLTAQIKFERNLIIIIDKFCNIYTVIEMIWLKLNNKTVVFCRAACSWNEPVS